MEDVRVNDLGEPHEVLTSLDRLAAGTSQDSDDLRPALAELVETGDAQVQRGQEPANAERLEAHQRFHLIMNWAHLHENRMELNIKGDDT
ncbi:DUF6042 family protein [Streptomyces sp. NPDC006691]|uniref:DUF6042 family protein n=1 Tax=Streptomyces sp. NPDC006691 TaxID=3364757 RepID=UPI00368C99CB